MASETDSKTPVPFYLDGKPVPGSATFPVINASTNETVHQAYNASEEDVQRAADSAGRAFKRWKFSSYTTRRTIIQKLITIMQREIDEFTRLIVSETSAAPEWAKWNIIAATSYLTEVASRISAVEGALPMNERPWAMNFIFKEPVGPVVCIPPWNGPLIMSTRGIATAIGAGCTVVLKCSELAPATHVKLVECFIEAGVPPGVLNSVQIQRSDAARVTEALIAHPDIRKIEFIGSLEVGKLIGAMAAKYMKPVLMELGGKCPAIVLDDANMEEAADMCAKGAMHNHGQLCFSTDRIIVVKGPNTDTQQFEKLLIDAFKQYHNPASGAGTRALAQHAADVLIDAKTKGARFLLAGPEFEGPATLLPSIVMQPSEDMRIRDEETFGPSACLYYVDTDKEAIELANKSEYGLNATIHTKDMARGLRMSRQLEYGQVHMNSVSFFNSATGSTGGVKGSGYGRQTSKYGFDEFTQEKFVTWMGKAPTVEAFG